ncbi:MAG TPA: SUMF1/EgtB/PvdO family nonheme iron enzyme [Woeseiaceae bacterium]|nr:SUMF1/EgtB/PvdO family nonheme iron enzyme [Woeseiaceae bacterium]
MKVTAIVIRDAEGERRYTLDRLPLRLGTGSDCEIRLPGPGNAPVASIDELDGEPFVQPVGRGGAVRMNGEALTTSRRLSAGDDIEFFGTRIDIAEQAGEMLARVRLEDSAYVTKPPEMADGTGAADETIAPTAFRRASETVAAAAPAHNYRWQTGIGIAVAALVLASYLLFSARSIQFDVLPGEPYDLSISGGWFRLPIGDRILLRPGDYIVNVSKAGYYDVSQSFEVGGEARSQDIPIEMRKLPGTLTVHTDPAVEAIVTVDEAQIGQAPYGPLEMQPGVHTVTVSADRFLPYHDRVAVPGLGKHQQLFVQLVPRWADVEITSEPSGAIVYRGDDRIGVTPARVELIEGTHQLSVVREGFKAWDGIIETAANEDRALPTIRLEPANAELHVITVPIGANVTVDGRYRGQSPISLALSPDVDYRIGVSKAGYGSAVRQVRLQAAASRELSIDMTARVGIVNVNVMPGDATVYVDGRESAIGSATLHLSSAPHRLEVRKAGHQTFTRSITPRPGYPQTIDVRLLTDEQVRMQSVAASLTTSQGQVLRRVEPGELVMGSSRSEQGRRANEVLVPVRVTKPFYISANEVTNKQFARFRANHNSGGDLHPALSGDSNPVTNVTWADAVEYCNWLSAEEGLPLAYEKRFEKWEPIIPAPDGYRLPTEAEWALAIRYQGRSRATVFPWGNQMPPRRDSGNYADRSAEGVVPSILPGYDDGYTSTAPVGSFPPNALGIHDGGGNVAEWVQDYYSVPTPGETEPLVDPTGPRSGTHHVIRGSSWRHAGILELRLAYRDFGSDGRFDVGFRIVRNAPEADDEQSAP